MKRARSRWASVVGSALWAACGAHAPAPAPTVTVTAADASREAANEIEFLLSYPATLFYALDAAAGAPNRDEGYRAWFAENGELPSWLRDYAEKREAWNSQRVGSRGTSRFDMCAWQEHELDAVTRCMRAFVNESDRAVFDQAVVAADRVLRPRWPALSQHSGALLPELHASMSSAPSQTLLRTLRRESALSDSIALRFTVVLVPKPPGTHSHARQEQSFFIQEVPEDQTAGDLLPIAFHETAHYAHELSPNRASMEEQFVHAGESGIFVANVWDEVVATAFGNGLAGKALDPSFREDANFYADACVDHLGRALFREWSSGKDVVLGADLALELVTLADREWPRARRDAAHYLWSFEMYGEDRNVQRAATRGLATRSVSRHAPLNDVLPHDANIPAWVTRIVLATHAQLAAHPALQSSIGMPARSWVEALHNAPAVAYLVQEANQPITMVVVANDEARLIAGMQAFIRLPQLPSPGWTPLP